MLLLQVHMAGQEPPPTLQGWRPEDSWWPGKKSIEKHEENIITYFNNSFGEIVGGRLPDIVVSTMGFQCVVQGHLDM